jgi:CheY-like chemotaxis protein
MSNVKHVQILLVEDNEGDILLISEALEEARIINKMESVRDGQKAIQYLKKEGNYEQAPTPDLVLLDINLPRKNGLEVLAFIKATEHLKQIPVVMLTTSSSPKDVEQAYKNYANCYITKPVGSDDFIKVIYDIENFWFSIVQLPPITSPTKK